METTVQTACVVTDSMEQTVMKILTIVLPIHVSMEHVLILLMDTTVPVKQDLLEQTVMKLSAIIVLPTHVSMEHVRM